MHLIDMTAYKESVEQRLVDLENMVFGTDTGNCTLRQGLILQGDQIGKLKSTLSTRALKDIEMSRDVTWNDLVDDYKQRHVRVPEVPPVPAVPAHWKPLPLPELHRQLMKDNKKK